MNRSFVYKPKVSFIGALLPPVAFFTIGLWCYYEGLRIVMGRLVLLPYPYSVYVPIGIGLVWLSFSIRSIKMLRDAGANPAPILLTEDRLILPSGRAGVVEIGWHEVAAVRRVEDEDGAKLVISTTTSHHYELDADYFESMGAFDDLEVQMRAFTGLEGLPA